MGHEVKVKMIVKIKEEGQMFGLRNPSSRNIREYEDADIKTQFSYRQPSGINAKHSKNILQEELDDLMHVTDCMPSDDYCNHIKRKKRKTANIKLKNTTCFISELEPSSNTKRDHNMSKYKERRYKNNIASRLCRQKQRIRNNLLTVELKSLVEKNIRLKQKANVLADYLKKCHEILPKYSEKLQKSVLDPSPIVCLPVWQREDYPKKLKGENQETHLDAVSISSDEDYFLEKKTQHEGLSDETINSFKLNQSSSSSNHVICSSPDYCQLEISAVKSIEDRHFWNYNVKTQKNLEEIHVDSISISSGDDDLLEGTNSRSSTASFSVHESDYSSNHFNSSSDFHSDVPSSSVSVEGSSNGKYNSELQNLSEKKHFDSTFDSIPVCSGSDIFMKNKVINNRSPKSSGNLLSLCKSSISNSQLPNCLSSVVPLDNYTVKGSSAASVSGSLTCKDGLILPNGSKEVCSCQTCASVPISSNNNPLNKERICFNLDELLLKNKRLLKGTKRESNKLASRRFRQRSKKEEEGMVLELMMLEEKNKQLKKKSKELAVILDKLSSLTFLKKVDSTLI